MMCVIDDTLFAYDMERKMGHANTRGNKAKHWQAVATTVTVETDNCSNMSRKEKKKKTRPDSHVHTNPFTLCLCGLGEPAKLSFLLLSEVSQRDPLVLPTCSSRSQTAEAAASQYTAEGEREGEESMAGESSNTHYRQLPWRKAAKHSSDKL